MKLFLEYWTVIVVLLQVAAVAITWWMKALAEREVERKVAIERERITATDKRVATSEGHIAELKRDVLNLPTKADIARLEGEVRAATREIGAANAGIERIEGYFIARGVERT